MGVKRPLRPEVAHRYGAELSIAEQLKNNPMAYGDPNARFDPVAEMQVLQSNNITDGSFLEESMKDWQEQGIAPQASTEVSLPHETLSPIQTTSDSEVDPNEPPTDPVEKMKWVAEKLREVNPNSPTANDLLNWKQMHGNVFVLQLGEDVYIYRYIKRQEWAQMMANPALAKMRQEQQEDMIVEKCLLFPRLSPERKAFLPAGAVGMLAEQIRIQSQFLDPQQVASITVKL